MWSWAIFVPHPPIIIPEVGRGGREGRCKDIGRNRGSAASWKTKGLNRW